MKYAHASLQCPPLCCLLPISQFLFTYVSEAMFSQQPSLPCAPRRTWRRWKKSRFPSVHAYSGRDLPLCQLACVAISWLLTVLHFTAGPSYTHARSTMVTSQLAEFALQSRYPKAMASVSSLRIRAQPSSHTKLPRADVGVEHWAVTDSVDLMGMQQELVFQRGVLCSAWSMEASSAPICLKLSDDPLLLT